MATLQRSSAVESRSGFRGVYPMVVPFYREDGRLDPEPIRRQVEAAVHHGCHGIGVTGLGSEVNKLSIAERRELVDLVAGALDRRIPLSVTVGENTIAGQIEFARAAISAGADWVILQPPPVADVSEAELVGFFGAVAEKLSVPIGVQNAAIYLSVGLSIRGLETLRRRHPNVCLLKTEDDPVTTARLVRETEGAFDVFVGRGGLDMLDEMRAGAVGVIPGTETLDRTARVFRQAEQGHWQNATTIYREVESMLVFLEKSINHFVTYEREIVARRLGIWPVRHRLGKEITPFALELVERFVEVLGDL